VADLGTLVHTGRQETVAFVENFQLTEMLFDAAYEAHYHDCPELAADLTRRLVSWLFKAGRYPTGWRILEKAVYGVATLALLAEADGAIPRLKAEVAKSVAAGELSDQSSHPLTDQILSRSSAVPLL
jgi:hypothetical protein